MKKDAFSSELAYIQKIMKKSEFAYKHFRIFFEFVAIYMFATGILLHLIRSYLYNGAHLTEDIYLGIYLSCITEVVCKIIFMIPLLIILNVYKRKIQESNQGISLWIFEVIRYIMIFCGFVLPVVVIFVTVSYEAADIFSILSAGLCLLICGVFSDTRSMVCISYIYFAIPAIVLVSIGALQWYTDYTQNVSHMFIWFSSYGRSIIYTVYPSIGYAIVSSNMRDDVKEKMDHGY